MTSEEFLCSLCVDVSEPDIIYKVSHYKCRDKRVIKMFDMFVRLRP